MIAARWGLHDPAHLSRALRAEFGRTPSEIRRAGQQNPNDSDSGVSATPVPSAFARRVRNRPATRSWTGAPAPRRTTGSSSTTSTGTSRCRRSTCSPGPTLSR
ncbi:AraC family transcriptional regulator [Streptomyces sp. NPDC054770]